MACDINFCSQNALIYSCLSNYLEPLRPGGFTAVRVHWRVSSSGTYMRLSSIKLQIKHREKDKAQ
jgi:hypothetical protein